MNFCQNITNFGESILQMIFGGSILNFMIFGIYINNIFIRKIKFIFIKKDFFVRKKAMRQFCDNWWHIRAAKMVRMWRSVQNIISGPTHCPNQTRMRCCLKPLIVGHHRESNFKTNPASDRSLEFRHPSTLIEKCWKQNPKLYTEMWSGFWIQ